jgi:predicted GNAT family N-acyltransferase
MKREIECCPPTDLSKEEIQACLSVVKEGDAVNLKSATSELPQAMMIAFRREGQNIVAVGVIKQKRPYYASTVAKTSGFVFDENIHELGYVAVTKTHRNRKLSHKITAELLSSFQSRPIFATTSEEAMKKVLEKAAFVKQGKEWQWKKGNRLSLWIKSAT